MASVKQNDETNMADEAEPTGGGGAAGEPKASQGKDKPAKAPEPVEYRKPGAQVAKAGAPGFFTIYKKGQGYWTRMGTVGGAGLIAIFTSIFIYEQVRAYYSPRTAYVADAVFLAVFSFVIFRVINRPNVVEFLIATDSEMKKVNWTTKAELIGSTKVVILFMLLIMALLFVFDVVFGFIFGPHGLHVLEATF